MRSWRVVKLKIDEGLLFYVKLGHAVALLEGRKVASCDVGGLRLLVVDAVKRVMGIGEVMKISWHKTIDEVRRMV